MAHEVVAPQDLDAEENVLGAMLLNETARDRVIPILEPRMFYRETHAMIYEHARALHQRAVPVDAITLVAELEQCQKLEAVGGKVRIHELAALVPATANAPHYATIVREAWRQRAALASARQIARMAEERVPADELWGAWEGSLADLTAVIERGRDEVITGYTAAEWLEAEMAKGPATDREGIAVPFRFMDRLRGGRLYVLGGPPKEGKTALATQHARACLEEDGRVGFWTLEMGWQDLSRRIVSTFGVPIKQLERRQVDDHRREAYRSGVAAMATWADRLHLWDGTTNAAAIRRRQRIMNYDLVVIDHLHFFDWEDRRDLEREVRSLAVMAVELDVPVLLLSQLKRTDKRPSMTDFRESAMIEADAAQAVAVYRKREKGLPTNEAEWLVLADRFGPARKEDLYFDGPCVRFTPLEHTD